MINWFLIGAISGIIAFIINLVKGESELSKQVDNDVELIIPLGILYAIIGSLLGYITAVFMAVKIKVAFDNYYERTNCSLKCIFEKIIKEV